MPATVITGRTLSLAFSCCLLAASWASLRSEELSGALQAGTKAGQEWQLNGLKMKFCWCPPGTFDMGSPPAEPFREENEILVPVTLTAGFWLGKHEVTQAEWRQVMNSTVVMQRDKQGKSNLLCGEGDAFPMYYVSHEEATTFCEKFTQQERAAGRLPTGWSYRLPTEAQWEFACRAGTTTATAFGTTLSSTQANFDGRQPYNGAPRGLNAKAALPVGSFAPNPWGLCDMHGNVMEWCRDWYTRKVPGGSDPEVTLKASAHVFRGGGWVFDGRNCRSAVRDYESPTFRDSALGFRLSAVRLRD